MSFRRWLAGWMCRLGGALISLGNRLYPPYPERRRYFIDHTNEPR